MKHPKECRCEGTGSVTEYITGEGDQSRPCMAQWLKCQGGCGKVMPRAIDGQVGFKCRDCARHKTGRHDGSCECVSCYGAWVRGVPSPHAPLLVILETPYAPSNGRTVAENEAYARACMRDSLLRGEAPIASHLLYTQPGVLDDTIPEQRRMGIQAGLAWGLVANLTACYVDNGISPGMREGIERAKAEGRPIELRYLANGCSPIQALQGDGVSKNEK